MTFADYWRHLQARNPGLADSSTRMTISVRSFQAALEQAWQTGGTNTRPATENEILADSLFGKTFGR